MINISNGKNSKIVIKNCNNTKKGTTDPEIISGIIENVIPVAFDTGLKIINILINKKKG